MEEVPDEISLCLNVSNCPYACCGCHTPMLQEDRGNNLEDALPNLLSYYKGRISCVCFMGEGNDMEALARCLLLCKRAGVNTAVYTGSTLTEWRVKTAWPFTKALFSDSAGATLGDAPLAPDYLKTGRYEKEKGPINSPSTNQRMFLRNGNKWEDITEKFWRKKE